MPENYSENYIEITILLNQFNTQCKEMLESSKSYSIELLKTAKKIHEMKEQKKFLLSDLTKDQQETLNKVETFLNH